MYNSLSKAFEENAKTAVLEQEKEHYLSQTKLMQDSSEKIQAVRHDMKLHLSAINGYASKIDAHEITNYVNTLLDGIQETETYSNTGNLAIDAVINFQLKTAREKNIKTEINLLVPSEMRVQDSDIAVILGNILSNAVHAVEHADEKIIKLNMGLSKGVLFIKAENTFSDEITYSSNGEIISGKPEGGHGLKNIQQAVEKYNGQIDIFHENNHFSVAIMLYANDN
jgi:sensor histidine kinase regulating citrate/malate metabolism